MTSSNRELRIDAGAIALVSLAICLASHRLFLMTFLVPLILATRCALWARLPRAERWGTWTNEAVLVAACLLLGAFNDWNSVVRHRIYDYDAPALWPSLTTVPEWMLLYWGMILRFVTTLAHAQCLNPQESAEPGTTPDPAWVRHRPAIELALVLITRQFIYRNFLDPLVSWLPFAAALFLYFSLFPPNRSEIRLVTLFLIGGPAAEILYIHVGRLHHYHLGWIGGVPLWIALWWVLAVLVWKDLTGRAMSRMRQTPNGLVFRLVRPSGVDAVWRTAQRRFSSAAPPVDRHDH